MSSSKVTEKLMGPIIELGQIPTKLGGELILLKRLDSALIGREQ